MKFNLIAAGIIALAVIFAAFLIGGRYDLVRMDGQKIARLDRWTGKMRIYTCSEEIDCELIYSGPSGSRSANATMNVDENLTTVDMNAVDEAKGKR